MFVCLMAMDIRKKLGQMKLAWHPKITARRKQKMKFDWQRAGRERSQEKG